LKDAGTSDLSWVCTITPQESDSAFGLGLRFTAPGTQVNFFEAKDGKINWRLYNETQSTPLFTLASKDLPANFVQVGRPVYFRLRHINYPVNGKNYLAGIAYLTSGGVTTSAGWYWPEAYTRFPDTGKAFVHSTGGRNTYENCFLATATEVTMQLTDCTMTDQELRDLIASIMGTAAANININKGCKGNARNALQAETTVSFTVLGSSSMTSQGMASSVVSTVSSTSTPALTSQGVTVTAAATAPAAVPTGIAATAAVAAAATAAALGAGAIAGIAVGATVVAAGATAGIVIGVKKAKANSTSDVEQDTPAKPAAPPRSQVRRSVYKMYQKEPGVNINMEEVDPDSHKSITARQHNIQK